MRFPLWASLAKDYLAIMGSSVLSERAFLSARITITKRRNGLQADIVEALQFLKCLIQKDLIYCEPQPSLMLELEYGNVLEDDGTTNNNDVDDPTGWEKLFIDAESNSDWED